MLTCCQSSNLVLSLSCPSAVLGCVSVSLPVLAILLGSYVKLLNVFYTAKQAETVSYTVVFNVLLNQLECIYNYIVYMKVVLLSKDIVASIITVHLWVFPSHSNCKGHAFSLHLNNKAHALSACLWFRKEAI